ncbi:MAG: nitroreductase family protein [Spirochaetaceae bacterium]
MALMPEIEDRVSIRDFTEEPISQEQLDSVLNAGRLAPSAKNRQAWRFVVVTDADLRNELQEASFGQEYVGKAPVIIAVCTTNVEYKMPNGLLSYPVDLGIAGAFMMIQAAHEGLGSCPITTFKEQEVKSLLTIPYAMRVVMLLLLGHPAESPEPPERNSLDRVVAYQHW